MTFKILSKRLQYCQCKEMLNLKEFEPLASFTKVRDWFWFMDFKVLKGKEFFFFFLRSAHGILLIRVAPKGQGMRLFYLENT